MRRFVAPLFCAAFLVAAVLFGASKLSERDISYEFVHALRLNKSEAAALVEDIQLSTPRDDQWAPECDHGRDSSYVPQDFEDALETLACTLEPEVLQEIYESSRSEMINYHFGLGLWMRNNWGLWAGSPLKSDLESRGLSHPDNMSGLILDSFWRKLRGHPIPFPPAQDPPPHPDVLRDLGL